MTQHRFSRRVAAMTAAAALALAGSACGDSEDGSDAAADRSASAEPVAATENGGTPRQQVLASFRRLQDGFAGKDAKAVCAQLTDGAQAKTVKDASKAHKSCEDVAAAMIESYGDRLTRPPTIERLRLDGDKAVMVVRTGATTTQKTPFAKTGDGWKLDEPIGF